MDGHQLSALLWLRWRLTRNQWRKGGQVSAVITIIAVWIGLSFGVLGGIAGMVGGMFGLAKATPTVVMLVWDGLVAVFSFFWVLGIVTELQRSEMVDLGRLLHLPISVKEVFLLNYLASHMSMSLAIIAPTMFGLTLGLVLGHGVAMTLLAPLILAFFFTITAWTYCLRGWLAALMVNQRRRRTVIVAVTMAFVLLAQLPNLVNIWFQDGRSSQSRNRATHSQRDHYRRVLDTFTLAHSFIPPLWLPLGARELTEGHVWPALCGTAGLFAIGSLGLIRAYRSTLRFYQGATVSGATSAPRAPRLRPKHKLLVERDLPVVSDEAAAVALANFRSMTRAPEVRLTLATSVVLFLIIGTGLLVRHRAEVSQTAIPFVASAAVPATFMGLLQLFFNIFGVDRQGFRALVLSPVSRMQVLFGKNLSLVPFAAAAFCITLTMVTVLVHLALRVILATALEFCAGFLVLSTLGNVTSVLLPYRIAAGSLRPTKNKATTALSIALVQMLVLPMLLPAFLPAGLGMLSDYLGWLPGVVVMLVSATVMTALAALLYWATLEPLGRLLQRREQKILDIVTREIE